MRRILYNAKVYVEKGVFRQAVLIEDDMIKAVGTDEEIKAMATDDTEMMDCGGKTLIPGLMIRICTLCCWAKRETRRR